MTSRCEQLENVAVLFTYPQIGWSNAVDGAAICAKPSQPALLEFARRIPSLPLSELQELYTSTFDLSPLCALDLGWHLFGEDYERGQFLARIRRELLAHDIRESCELPDHLSHALLLLARMEPAQAEEFATAIIAPALERMLKCIPADNPFNLLLMAVQQLVRFHFPAAFTPVSPIAEGVTL